MSFDPFGQQPDPQRPQPPGGPPPGGPNQPTPPGWQTRSVDDGGRPPGHSRGVDAGVRERVQLPASFLITLNALNVLVALFGVGFVAYFSSLSADAFYKRQLEQIEEAAKANSPMKEFLKAQAEELRKRSPEELKQTLLIQYGVITALTVLATLLGLIGSIRMLQLRSYGLAITGAIATAVPCVTLSGCCCGLGQVFAVWAIVVLMSPDVRAAFR